MDSTLQTSQKAENDNRHWETELFHPSEGEKRVFSLLLPGGDCDMDPVYTQTQLRHDPEQKKKSKNALYKINAGVCVCVCRVCD